MSCLTQVNCRIKDKSKNYSEASDTKLARMGPYGIKVEQIVILLYGLVIKDYKSDEKYFAILYKYFIDLILKNNQ